MEFMSALQNGYDESKPSLFELLSEQQLSTLIPPSLRYLLALATHRRPRYLLRILNSFDELYALLALIIERHYLLTYGGSFTENFYGLKRERVLRIKGGEAPHARIGASSLMRETLRLRTKDVWANLAVLVGLPYLKRKLDENFDIYASHATFLGPNYSRDTLPNNPTIRQRILWCYKWFLRNIYPSINAAYYFSLLVFNLAYLFDNTQSSSPFLWLIGTRIRRMEEADYRAIALADDHASSSATKPTEGLRPGQNNNVLSPKTMGRVFYPKLLSGLRILLPTSVFALKFLEWWHASDFARQLSRKAAEGLDLPPPIISGLPAEKSQQPQLARTERPLQNRSQITTANTVSLSSSAPLPYPPSPSKETSLMDSIPAQLLKPPRPISSLTQLPILTVPPLTQRTSPLCPICLSTIQTPTAVQTGYVFCYTCIFKWVEGSHERQQRFMEGNSGGIEGWGEDEDVVEAEKDGNKEGRWESGRGRCAVTGRRVLGGTEGLRRVIV